MITVDEIMTTDLQTLGPEDSLEDANYCMGTGGFRHLPIVDKSGELVGLVTQSDVLSATGSNVAGQALQRHPGEILVEEFMTRDVTTVDPRADLRQTALYLQKHKYGCLPVVADGELKGIVTDSDFVGVAINLMEQVELAEPEEEEF